MIFGYNNTYKNKYFVVMGVEANIDNLSTPGHLQNINLSGIGGVEVTNLPLIYIFLQDFPLNYLKL